MKKRSINRAAEAAGFRTALAHIAEADALLHIDPAVLAIRERIRANGLKAVMAEYRVAPSSVTNPNSQG
jgi:enoyl-CoA hydratase